MKKIILVLVVTLAAGIAQVQAQAQTKPLSKEAAERTAATLAQQRDARLRAELRAEWESQAFTTQTLNEDGQLQEFTMKFWDTIYGPTQAPAGGRSMYISMHGGGSGPAQMNDGQWRNQKYLYRNIQEGLYFVPRAPTNTWNMWHQGYMDIFLRKAIAAAVLFEGVDPDRVYITGYSAGGDGTFQMAPRMADHWAAAAMMAGHPGDAQAEMLLNLPFALYMGGEDGAYNRNGLAREWQTKLDLLAIEEGRGYVHDVHIYEGLPHWMNRNDTVAMPWMAQFTRNPYPPKVIWIQDNILRDNFYWLGVPPALKKQGDRVVARVEGQTVYVEQMDPAAILIGLNDRMIDLGKPVTVIYGGNKLGTVRARRTAANLNRPLDPSPYSLDEPCPVILKVEKVPSAKAGATVTAL